MKFRLAIYQHRAQGLMHWTTLGLGPHTHTTSARTRQKLQQVFSAEMGKLLRKLKPGELDHFQTRWGWDLKHTHLELTIRANGKKIRASGQFPLVFEPRWLSEDERIELVYHPRDQKNWFVLRPDLTLEEQARAFFQHVWKDKAEDDLISLMCKGGDSLTTLALSAKPETLLDTLPDVDDDPWKDLEIDLDKGKNKKKKKKKKGLKLLPELATDLTQRAIHGGLVSGMPRQPYSDQIQMLVGGKQRRSVVLVGPPGVGKRTLLYIWIHKLLEQDGFEGPPRLRACAACLASQRQTHHRGHELPRRLGGALQ